MTPQELQQYLSLISEIARLESELQGALNRKYHLARILYERHGKDATYKVGDQYLMIAPTKTGTYYFVPRVRWPSEARAARAEKKRLDRIARLQRMPQRKPEPSMTTREAPKATRRIEATATLSRTTDPRIEACDPKKSDTSLDVGEESQGDGLGNLLVSAAASPMQSGSVVPSAQDLTSEVEGHHHTPGSFSDKHHLPIVGDVEQPSQVEPRLLQIHEPLTSKLDDLDP